MMEMTMTKMTMTKMTMIYQNSTLLINMNWTKRVAFIYLVIYFNIIFILFVRNFAIYFIDFT